MGRHGSEQGRRRLVLSWVAILSVAAAALVHGQSDFLNIDCGKAQGYAYNDTRTGLFYTSDHQYVTTGEIHKVSSLYQSQPGYFTQSYDLRSFPAGTRNCYTLPVTPDRKYLLRASFMYGNYDGKDQLPQFAVYAGVNYWYSVTVTNSSTNLYQDYIFVTGADKGSTMDFCLVNTGGGTPFVSALELRPLPDEVYPQANVSQALMSVSRTNVGATLLLRYPDDIYDRFWTAYSPTGWTSVTTPSPVQTVAAYQTPSEVLRTAVYPTTGSTLNFSYTIPLDTATAEPRVHVFLYFAELQQLKANDSRVFNITLNDQLWFAEPVNPAYLKENTVHTINPEKANPLNFVLVQTTESTLPPIINAAEVYMVRDMTGVETAQQDADAIKAIKKTYQVKKNWEGDPCSPRSFIWEGLNCSSDVSKSPKITSLNLTSSGLTGDISSAIGNLTQLQTLDLSRNSLTGGIPAFLANLAQLKYLDLSGNKLNGSVPQTLLDRSATGALTLKVGSQADSCSGSASCDSKKSTSKVVPAIAASVGAVVVLAIIIAAVVIWRKKKPTGRPGKIRNSGAQKKHRSSSFNMSSLHIESKQFKYAELERITNNFQKEIGRGGFGPVYYGVLENNAEVAVKLLSKTSSQGPKEFQNEALLLTRIHHRNLVSFVGYCNDNIDNLALIYEYMAQGSLQDHLRGKSGKFNGPLDWTTRLNIAVEAAQGLEYLHHGCKPSIVHRDVKTNNILLNQNFEAKIADFGLSRFFEKEGHTHVTTRVMGTPGYLDPEYYVTNKLTEKSDVYSFGIVLLELITGLPSIITAKDNINLVNWVKQKLEHGDIGEIVDKRLQGKYDINSVWKAVETALACTPHVSLQRPNMSEVLGLLKDCTQLEKGNANVQSTSKVNENNANNNTSVELLSLDMSTISYPSAR